MQNDKLSPRNCIRMLTTRPSTNSSIIGRPDRIQMSISLMIVVVVAAAAVVVVVRLLLLPLLSSSSPNDDQIWNGAQTHRSTNRWWLVSVQRVTTKLKRRYIIVVAGHDWMFVGRCTYRSVPLQPPAIGPPVPIDIDGGWNIKSIWNDTIKGNI